MVLLSSDWYIFFYHFLLSLVLSFLSIFSRSKDFWDYIMDLTHPLMCTILAAEI